MKKIEVIIRNAYRMRIFTKADLSFSVPGRDPVHMSFSKGILHQVYGHRIFDIASGTKMILALLVYRLLTIGCKKDFTLDAPVNRFIDISGPHTDKLTIYHLLTFHAKFNKFITPAEMRKEINKTKRPDQVFKLMLKQIESVGLESPPGLHFNYANIHSILLGRVLENVFEKSLEELMHLYLFAPIGLRNTTVNPAGKLNRFVHSKHDLPLGKISDPVASLSLDLFKRLLGSAGLVSTTRELLHILNVILLDERHPTCPIQSTFAQELHKPVTEKGDFGQGLGLWSEFLKNLEDFHPCPPHDMVFKSGFSGVVCACSKSTNISFAFATNFLYKRRSKKAMSLARRTLHEVYAGIASCICDAQKECSS